MSQGEATHRRSTSPRRFAHRTNIFLAATVCGFAVVVLVTAWQIDERHHRNRVASHTKLAGHNVSGQSPSQLLASLTAIRDELRDSPMKVGPANEQFNATARDIDLVLDVDRTAERVQHFSHKKPAATRFHRWLTSRFTPSNAPVQVNFDAQKLAALIATKDPGPRTPPTEPTFSYNNGSFEIRNGRDGSGLGSNNLDQTVEAAVRRGSPLRIAVQREALPPRFTTRDAQQAAHIAETITQQALPISAATSTVTVSVDQLRSWLEAVPSENHLDVGVNVAKVSADLTTLLPNAGTPVKEAGYTVENNIPRRSDGTPGTACCSTDSGATILAALTSRKPDQPSPTVVLPLNIVQPKTTAADLPDLGIKEAIGSFTTRHPAGQPRVTNIHLIADLTRGTVIQPGATFSINRSVGERTAAKGFVVDHVIEDGKFAESVGGGISQFATTLFNAGFFGGLDFGEYQAHTIYIDRYPYGREATVSFPHPDLQIKNTTPYGVLIWPTYTDTSLTVTLYSTVFATGQQTGQTTEAVGTCTRVRTERTRTYADGHTATDNVSALYQAKEGERC